MLKITQYPKIFLTIIYLIIATQTKADMWIDPTWNRMLDSSDVIALIQYTSNGDFRASAKILTIYKGNLKSGDEIFISGFSNRYGPIDKMNKGDKYLVFINLNDPSTKGLEYWNVELTKKPELKDFVEAYKNKQAYYVWSPTTGDLKVKGKKVQYDLIQTTFYRKQNFHSLNDFETFLTAYLKKETAVKFSKTILKKIKPKSENDLDLVAQQLMKLYLIGYNKYEDIFKSYVQVGNAHTKYALVKLMGTIKTEESRNILISLLGDSNSIVQGEVVRQLKNEPAELVAPILHLHLKTSSEINFGPSNIMNPVMNRIDGGKVEIIKTLGELKYTPAIPDLLLLLDTDNDYLFKLVINALKNIGTKEYIPYINKHLDNKTQNLIFSISVMIVNDSLAECLPSFKNFIATCNRNEHPSYEYTISKFCGIGHFEDSATIAFLLSDFKHFFTYKDTLESSKQKYWTRNYIETFTHLKVKEARTLIYKAIFDWSGLNEDFVKHPKLFDVKKQLEDSIKVVFSNGLEKRGYKLNHCIAFIENTSDILKGAEPKVKYLIEVTIPTKEKGDEHQELISNELKLSKENIFLIYKNGSYYIEKQERFDKSHLSTPIYYFLNYVKVIPNPVDRAFFQALLDNNFVNENEVYFQKMILETIEKIK